jgi:hypothetical protein
MIEITKIEDVYPAIDELIKVLAQKNEQRVSDILDHRMYKVSWTSSGELFEELQGVLKNFLQEKRSDLDNLIVGQIEEILKTIERSL